MRGCGRSFNPLTGTLLYSRKIPLSEWVEFLLHLFEFHPVKTSARDNRNAERSGKYWLTKVFSALDGKELLVASEWRSKPAKRSTLELFGKHITPRPTLVYDGDNSHRGLIEALGLESEVHDKLKRFLRSHGGYARMDLQGWLNLFWFIWSEPKTRYEKAARLIKMAISAKKVIRYRDLYGKKD